MAMEVEISAEDQLQEKAENDWKARLYYAREEGVAIGERKKQQEMARKACEISAEDQQRTRKRLQEKAENDWKARVYYAWKEGYEEGYKEGFEKGFKEGFREGFEKGLAESTRKYNIEVARRALSMLLSDEVIAQVTGLALEEIAALRAEQSEQGTC